MKSTVIIFPSLTYAMKVKKILDRKGIRSKVVKISSDSNGASCIYGVRVSYENYYDVIDMLIKNRIEYSVYSENYQ